MYSEAQFFRNVSTFINLYQLSFLTKKLTVKVLYYFVVFLIITKSTETCLLHF